MLLLRLLLKLYIAYTAFNLLNRHFSLINKNERERKKKLFKNYKDILIIFNN